MYLLQLQAEGYSIFVITGDLPNSDADEEARIIPQPPPEALISPRKSSNAGPMKDEFDETLDSSDADLQAALRASMLEGGKDVSLANAIKESLGGVRPSAINSHVNANTSMDDSIARAIQATLAQYSAKPAVPNTLQAPPLTGPSGSEASNQATSPKDEAEKLRQKRLARFGGS
jgi:hypothetical protein